MGESTWLLAVLAAVGHAPAVVGVSASLEAAQASLEPTAAPKSVPLCSPDEELVEAHLGANSTAHLIRHRLRKMGTSPALNAPRETLLRDLAAGLRAQVQRDR